MFPLKHSNYEQCAENDKHEMMPMHKRHRRDLAFASEAEMMDLLEPHLQAVPSINNNINTFPNVPLNNDMTNSITSTLVPAATTTAVVAATTNLKDEEVAVKKKTKKLKNAWFSSPAVVTIDNVEDNISATMKTIKDHSSSKYKCMNCCKRFVCTMKYLLILLLVLGSTYTAVDRFILSPKNNLNVSENGTTSNSFNFRQLSDFVKELFRQDGLQTELNVSNAIDVNKLLHEKNIYNDLNVSSDNDNINFTFIPSSPVISSISHLVTSSPIVVDVTAPITTTTILKAQKSKSLEDETTMKNTFNKSSDKYSTVNIFIDERPQHHEQQQSQLTTTDSLKIQSTTTKESPLEESSVFTTFKLIASPNFNSIRTNEKEKSTTLSSLFPSSSSSSTPLPVTTILSTTSSSPSSIISELFDSFLYSNSNKIDDQSNIVTTVSSSSQSPSPLLENSTNNEIEQYFPVHVVGVKNLNDEDKTTKDEEITTIASTILTSNNESLNVLKINETKIQENNENYLINNDSDNEEGNENDGDDDDNDDTNGNDDNDDDDKDINNVETSLNSTMLPITDTDDLNEINETNDTTENTSHTIIEFRPKNYDSVDVTKFLNTTNI